MYTYQNILVVKQKANFIQMNQKGAMW